MTMESSGTAYIVVLHRVGDHGGIGAYQNAKQDVFGNKWREYEFPTLQRNPRITSVISVDSSDGWAMTEDWNPNMKECNDALKSDKVDLQ